MLMKCGMSSQWGALGKVSQSKQTRTCSAAEDNSAAHRCMGREVVSAAALHAVPYLERSIEMFDTGAKPVLLLSSSLSISHFGIFRTGN